VDISASMLSAARRHDRHPDRCTYHLNTRSDLALFTDGSFTFAYSTLVLQHMEPRYARSYIRELLRVLAPGGLLVFQLPSHRVGPAPSIGTARTPVSGPLPAAAFKARLTVDAPSLSLAADDVLALRVRVENRSTEVWPALPGAWGRHRLNVANRWLDESGGLVRRDDARSPLPHDVAPGSYADLVLGVTAPSHDGSYWLELDLVQENVSWFAQKGSDVLRVRCRVTGGLVGPVLRVPSQRLAGTREPAGKFRERHPRVFGVLRVTRLRDVYWMWRRAADRVKARRDRLIVAVGHPLVNWWLRAITWWKSHPFAARMEMYCVPRAEVLRILAEGGGRIVDVEEEPRPGGFQSCRYWVCKDAS
jgi:SAM-dependent methyltransferase